MGGGGDPPEAVRRGARVKGELRGRGGKRSNRGLGAGGTEMGAKPLQGAKKTLNSVNTEKGRKKNS